MSGTMDFDGARSFLREYADLVLERRREGFDDVLYAHCEYCGKSSTIGTASYLLASTAPHDFVRLLMPTMDAHRDCKQFSARVKRGGRIAEKVRARLDALVEPHVLVLGVEDFEAFRAHLRSLAQVFPGGGPPALDAGTFWQSRAGGPRHEVVAARNMARGLFALGAVDGWEV